MDLWVWLQCIGVVSGCCVVSGCIGVVSGCSSPVFSLEHWLDRVSLSGCISALVCVTMVVELAGQRSFVQYSCWYRLNRCQKTHALFP